MPSLKKKKDARLYADRKVRFLGRFFSEKLLETTLDRLRDIVQGKSGAKTRLKLSPTGISTGSKFGSVFGKAPAGSIPLSDIIDVVVDQKLRELLLIIAKRVDGKYEILAYRVGSEAEGLVFQGTYADITTRVDNDAASTGFIDSNPIYDRNWMMKTTTQTLDRQPRTPRGTRANGYLPTSNGMTLNDATYRRVARSTADIGHSRFESSSSSRHHHGSASDLLDYNQNIRRRDYDDNASVASAVSVESMKKELVNLTREVQQLRSMLTDQRSEHGMDDNASVMTTGTLLESRNGGVVKTKVQDHRPRSYSQSHSHSGMTSASNRTGVTSTSGSGHGVYITDTPSDEQKKIRLVYMREGEDETDLHPGMSSTLPRRGQNGTSLSRHNSSYSPREASVAGGAVFATATISRQPRASRTSQANPHVVQRSKSVDAQHRMPRESAASTSTFNYPPPSARTYSQARVRGQNGRYSPQRHPTYRTSSSDRSTHYAVR